jgi:hypothetical protein
VALLFTRKFARALQRVKSGHAKDISNGAMQMDAEQLFETARSKNVAGTRPSGPTHSDRVCPQRRKRSPNMRHVCAADAARSRVRVGRIMAHQPVISINWPKRSSLHR